ncbi:MULTISPECIES: CpaD family pilus assembly protein [Hyphobacterium]|uniref:CpaD family pilus assembly protein n=1 Tax=Hyphobacterium vulgare TaxID=1736751 RepID=A0ABV6ZVD3_9PROT
MTRITLLLLSAAGLALSGCYTMPRDRAGDLPQPYVTQETARFELAMSANEGGLAWSQMGAFSAFIDAYRTDGAGPLVVTFPDGVTDAEVADGAMSELYAYLDGRGIGAHVIASGAYDAQGSPIAPIIVSYMVYAAHAPRECENLGWSNLAGEFDNRAYPRFGCATAANYAAMVGNAYDLVGPSSSAPADAGRNATIMDRWRAGQPTSSQRSEDESGAVSQVAE